jgi:hypothetical protein
MIDRIGLPANHFSLSARFFRCQGRRRHCGGCGSCECCRPQSYATILAHRLEPVKHSNRRAIWCCSGEFIRQLTNHMAAFRSDRDRFRRLYIELTHYPGVWRHLEWDTFRSGGRSRENPALSLREGGNPARRDLRLREFAGAVAAALPRDGGPTRTRTWDQRIMSPLL